MAKKTATAASEPFNILSRGSKFVAEVRESLVRAETNAKRSHFVLGPDERLLIPCPELVLQQAIGCRGFFSGTLMDIIGGDGLGKTTLIFTMAGWFLRHNCPVMYIETENKPMLRPRVEQCLHTSRSLASAMYDSIYMDRAFEIRDAVIKVNEWLMTIRDPKNDKSYVPLNYPAFIGLDTFSKLLAPQQAGNVAYYKGEAKADEKLDLGGGTNQEHAKLAHAWCRELPAILSAHNAVLCLGRHQNEAVDMSGGKGGGGSFISPEVKASFNRKSIGGQAFSQNAALQFVLSRTTFDTRQIDGERVQVGMNIKLKVTKNSFGPPGQCSYTLMLKPLNDTADMQTPALNWAAALPDLLADNKLLPITIKNARALVCREFGLDEVTPEQLHALVHARPELIQNFAERLQLAGYGSKFVAPPLNPVFSVAAIAPDDASEKAE